MSGALGMIEAIGLTSAMTAVDAACKAADIQLVGQEKVIGAGGSITITVYFTGEVAAIQSGVEAGVKAAEISGRVLSYRVIPRPDEDVMNKLIRIKKKVHQKTRSKDPKGPEKEAKK